MSASSTHNAVGAPVPEKYVICFWFLLSPFRVGMLREPTHTFQPVGCSHSSSSSSGSQSIVVSSSAVILCNSHASVFSLRTLSHSLRIVADAFKALLSPLHVVTRLTASLMAQMPSLSPPAEKRTWFFEAHPHAQRADIIARVQFDGRAMSSIPTVWATHTQHNDAAGQHNSSHEHEELDYARASDFDAITTAFSCVEKNRLLLPIPDSLSEFLT